MNDTITISRSEMDAARELFARMGLGGGRAVSNLNLSFSPRAQKVFAHKDLRARQGMQFAQPGLSDVHIDQPLTNISVAYRNRGYIAPLLFPRVPVQKESGLYFIFDQAPWLRDEAKPRAVSATYDRVGYTLSTSNYSVTEYGMESPIDDRIRANADDPINVDRSAVNLATDKVDLKYEIVVKTMLRTAGNWTTTVDLSGDATKQWNAPTTSDPFGDMRTGRRTVIAQSGMDANTLVLGYDVYSYLAIHPDLIDRCKYTGTMDRPAMVTPSMMAALFEVDQVLIGKARLDSSNEGGASSVSFLWGKDAWLGYVADAPAIETPSAGYVFTTGRGADRYREEQTRSDIVRVREAFDARVTASGAGYLLQNAVG